MSRVPGGLWPKLLTVQVYGANTGIGKTIVSTLIANHLKHSSTPWLVHYLKPVSTGPESDNDGRYVQKYAHTMHTTLFQFSDAVSPHIAARNANYIPKDNTIIKRLAETLRQHAINSELHAQTVGNKSSIWGLTLVETAGAVLSPGPSGELQADLFRPLRLPILLVGDRRLGGIGSTISAYESLHTRGYDVDAVVCFESGELGNSEFLSHYFKHRNIPSFTFPWIPNLEGCSEQEETQKMQQYYHEVWQRGDVGPLVSRISYCHAERIKNLDRLKQRTVKVIWHPFTQHRDIRYKHDLMVFDSAYGDFFQAKHDVAGKSSGQSMLYPSFDGSASWWTQGLGHGNPKLALAAAYAAGRYGHVMFAGATHEPAVALAEKLVDGMENPRLTRVFYTDNGSTAVEVGIKMALRAACVRYGWDGSTEDIGVIGLKGSYHGDTIGAMDASEPCIYNKKVDWYRGRGYWFDYPSVKLVKGRWIIAPPRGMEKELGPTQTFDELDEIFDFQSRGRSLTYEKYIKTMLDSLVQKQGKRFGALILEPIILGAGGMIFVDPLFQKSLVEVVRRYSFVPEPASSGQTGGNSKNEASMHNGHSIPSPSQPDENSWSGLPVIFDEVFTGLYRLGRFSAASFLSTHPDISVHAKLLTGGLLPLSATLASQSIFDAFLGDDKASALLHGHSYTAHPIGCHVANVSLDMMKGASQNHDWKMFKKSWVCSAEKWAPKGGVKTPDQYPNVTWSMWSKDTVVNLSHHENVESVVALGSVLALSLVDESAPGYSSTAATGLRDSLINNVIDDNFGIHCRVLGNVLYLIARVNSKHSHLVDVEKALLGKLANNPRHASRA